jgi:hypothetical protein
MEPTDGFELPTRFINPPIFMNNFVEIVREKEYPFLNPPMVSFLLKGGLNLVKKGLLSWKRKEF